MAETPLEPGQILDGYVIIRQIGAGGFGTVWLCRSELTGSHHALKFLIGGSSNLVKKELRALIHYQQASNRLRSLRLMPIQHINRLPSGLFYIMPLADGDGADSPVDPHWKPRTLAALIARQAEQTTWFTPAEVRDLIRPIIDALQILLDAGLVHRDVKPENILFFDNQPCLADISLLSEDASVITRHGTPGYSTPSWYLDAGGHPDMYGAAATLYTLLTGNLPDKMGKSRFLWPPQGEGSLSQDDKKEWQRLHKIVLRATEEYPSNRFLHYRAFAEAIQGKMFSEPRLFRSKGFLQVADALAVLVVVLIGYSILNDDAQNARLPSTQNESPSGVPAINTVENADYATSADLAVTYFKEKNYLSSLELLDHLFETYPDARQNHPLHSTLRARSLFELGRKDEARQELKASLASGPIDVGNFTQRIQLWERLGDLEGAEAEADHVLREMPPITIHYMLRARVRLLRGNFDGVEEDIHAASTLDDDPASATLATKLRSDYAQLSPAYVEYLGKKGMSVSFNSEESEESPNTSAITQDSVGIGSPSQPPKLDALLSRIPDNPDAAADQSAPSTEIPRTATYIERIKIHFKNGDFDAVERELHDALSEIEDDEHRERLLEDFRSEGADSVPYYGRYLKTNALFFRKL